MNLNKVTEKYTEYCLCFQSEWTRGNAPEIAEECMNFIPELVEEIEKLKTMLTIAESGTEEDDKTKTRYADEIKELRSLCLWSVRRLFKGYKNFAYDEYERITGEKPERL